MEDNRKTREFDTPPVRDTQVPETASDNAAALCNDADGALCEFVRGSSKEYAKALRKFKWRTPRNARFVVYCAFFAVLALFSAYSICVKEWYIAAFSLAVTAFMLYIVLWGHAVFVSGMAEDEGGEGAKIRCRFAADRISLCIDEKREDLAYSSVSRFRQGRKYIYLIFKNSKLCKNGLVFSEKDAANASDAETRKKIKNLFVK